MEVDWSSWDLGSARRALFGNNEAVTRRVLRRLHLRWFHANKRAMKRMLSAGGVAQGLADGRRHRGHLQSLPIGDEEGNQGDHDDQAECT
eukprot:6718644-Pyramimonas_sp.AAC.1